MKRLAVALTTCCCAACVSAEPEFSSSIGTSKFGDNSGLKIVAQDDLAAMKVDADIGTNNDHARQSAGRDITDHGQQGLVNLAWIGGGGLAGLGTLGMWLRFSRKTAQARIESEAAADAEETRRLDKLTDAAVDTIKTAMTRPPPPTSTCRSGNGNRS